MGSSDGHNGGFANGEWIPQDFEGESHFIFEFERGFVGPLISLGRVEGRIDTS